LIDLGNQLADGELLPAMDFSSLYTLATEASGSDKFNQALEQLRDVTPGTTENYEVRRALDGFAQFGSSIDPNDGSSTNQAIADAAANARNAATRQDLPFDLVNEMMDRLIDLGNQLADGELMPAAFSADSLYALATEASGTDGFNQALAQLRDATPDTTEIYDVEFGVDDGDTGELPLDDETTVADAGSSDAPDDSGSPTGPPLRDNYDFLTPDNVKAYLNELSQRNTNGLTLDPRDIQTSKTLLFNCYGYPMGDLRGNTADELKGSLDDQSSAAYMKALAAFSKTSSAELQSRYDFYSGIQVGGSAKAILST
jgi:hypothetical protein